MKNSKEAYPNGIFLLNSAPFVRIAWKSHVHLLRCSLHTLWVVILLKRKKEALMGTLYESLLLDYLA